ncbi:MAG: hypothetical protein PUC50_13740 [Bacteroidales bacterium]|nr:hypothetical protein [Bacteroidales bacterium]
MKKILSIILSAVILSITNVRNADAQENVGGLLSEAKTELLNRKCDLLEGRSNFENRINSLRDSANQMSLNTQRIEALNSGIRDIDSTIAKIDIALDAIQNSGMVNSYSNRVEINRNGNTIKIYRRVSDKNVTVEVNNERVVNGDGFDPVNIFDACIVNKKKQFKGHLSGIFLGINGLLNNDFKAETPEDYPFFALNESRSLDLSIYFNDFTVPFSKNFGLVSGFALQFNHYSLQEHFDLVVVDNKIAADYDNTVAPEFKRFNYRIMHFNVPLVFEFCTCENSKFYINAGIMGGVRIGSRTKQIYTVDDDRQKKCVRKPFETNLLKYSFIGGFGYGGVQIFGEYSPVSLFKEGHGPELYPFSLGIKWIF